MAAHFGTLHYNFAEIEIKHISYKLKAIDIYEEQLQKMFLILVKNMHVSLIQSWVFTMKFYH